MNGLLILALLLASVELSLTYNSRQIETGKQLEADSVLVATNNHAGSKQIRSSDTYLVVDLGPRRKGDRGDRGHQGDKGEPGKGRAGPKGDRGPQGDSGLEGSRGPMGRSGVSGGPGSPGLSGPMGPMGPVGPDGLKGPAGPSPVGPIGVVGHVGPSGPQGDPGNPGSDMAATVLPDCPTNISDWCANILTTKGIKCYCLGQDSTSSWDEALKYCNSITVGNNPMTLASIPAYSDLTTVAYVTSQFRQFNISDFNPYYWTAGASDQAGTHFVWADGSPVDVDAFCDIQTPLSDSKLVINIQMNMFDGHFSCLMDPSQVAGSMYNAFYPLCQI